MPPPGKPGYSGPGTGDSKLRRAKGIVVIKMKKVVVEDRCGTRPTASSGRSLPELMTCLETRCSSVAV